MDHDAELILDMLKTRMKEKGKTYRDLARELGLSLPTVKRMMSGGEFTLDRLLRICSWLGLSFVELSDGVRARQEAAATFTPAQEKALARNLPVLNFFLALEEARGETSRVKARFGLSERSMLRYLEALERIGLVKLSHAGEPVLATSPARRRVWDDHGPLGQVHARAFIEGMAARAVSSLGRADGAFVRTVGAGLSDRAMEELKRDFEIALAKARAAPKPARGRSQQVSILFLMDAWTNPRLEQVPEFEESMHT